MHHNYYDQGSQTFLLQKYLLKAAHITAEYGSTGVGLNHDLPLLLGHSGEIQPSLHRLPSETQQLKSAQRKKNNKTVIVLDY